MLYIFELWKKCKKKETNLETKPGIAKVGSVKKNPVIENFGKHPLSGEAGTPYHRRTKRAGKFLGFFKDFSGKI